MLFERMASAGIEQDRVTYNTVVRACERAGQYQVATDIRMLAMQANVSVYIDGSGASWDGSDDGWEREEEEMEAQMARRRLLRDQRQ